MSVLSTQLKRKDIPTPNPSAVAGATTVPNVVDALADKNVTNGGTKDTVTPLGTVIPPGATRRLTSFGWNQIDATSRTLFSLTAVNVA